MTAANGTARTPARIGIVGRGRVGKALAGGLARAGYAVEGPLGRGELPESDVVLLCVPDSEIEAAAAHVRPSAALVGHTSGATPLTALGEGEAFGLHPLQTIVSADSTVAGSGAAIAGSSRRALETARELARTLGMEPFEIDDSQRAAYHAAASIASNYLLAVEAAAETVAAGAGIAPADARRMLGPLVRQTVENWQRLGPERALTGPVARGDEETVERQAEAVESVAPELAPLFAELTEATRGLRGVPAA
jgi:predicted short-subunit dehydrogenase-like oxidoreductase (DUF2520 family)